MHSMGYPPSQIDIENLTEGEIPIVLKQLECLELKLNAMTGCSVYLPEPDVIAYFISKPSENKIILTVRHRTNVDQKLLDAIIHNRKTLYSAYIEALNWDWVKLEIEIKEVEIDELTNFSNFIF